MSDQDSIFAVIQSHPGCSRDDVRKHLIEAMSETELTNALTRLRRQGRIQNQGTRKNPIWYIQMPEAQESLESREDDLFGLGWKERVKHREEVARLLVLREGTPYKPTPGLYEMVPPDHRRGI